MSADARGLAPAWLLAALLGAGLAHVRGAGAAVPSRAEVRAAMDFPSPSDEFRGQRDTVGYARRPAQMARVWEWSATPPAPDSLGPSPAPGVIGVLAPHDDYGYAARVYRRVMPLLTARTVIVIGAFHGYRRFEVRDSLVFESYGGWAAPDGPVPTSPLRTDVLDRMPTSDFVVSEAMHDSEHSVEALVYWLRHLRPDVEILPIIVPAARFERFQTLADHLAEALDQAMRARGWQWGRDVAIAISSDAVHYGRDFDHVPFGAGSRKAYARATARDRALLTGPLRGALADSSARRLFETFVDPERPDRYRVTWCGRFAVPFGVLLLERLAERRGLRAVGHPVAYATSLSALPLPVREAGLGLTAPASLRHFVGYPAAAFTFEPAHSKP